MEAAVPDPQPPLIQFPQNRIGQAPRRSFIQPQPHYTHIRGKSRADLVGNRIGWRHA
jgi:hypothetical protein